MNHVRQPVGFGDHNAEYQRMTSSYPESEFHGGSGLLGRSPVLTRKNGASSPVEPSLQLPEELWLLVLAWSGLRTSATAAACSSAFRCFHRTVTSTPALLARALFVDHGLPGAAVNLYGSPAGHPHARHAVRNDADVSATLRDLVVLSAPPGIATVATAVAVTAAAATAIAVAEAISADDEGSIEDDLDFKFFTQIPAAIPQAASCLAWGSGGDLAFRELFGGLLCAAASAGHVQMAAMTLAFGACEVDRALIAACAAGRRHVVQLLLASGADPDAAEPFGHCALYEAARNGNSDVVEVLLDAGARMDGAIAAATVAASYDGRLSSVFAPFSIGRSTVSAPPPFDPWRFWPAMGGILNPQQRQGLADKEAPQNPMPLRVPIPLTAASANVALPSAAGAGTPTGTPTGVFDVHDFFSESGSTGLGPAAFSPQYPDGHPKTPTATAAATATTWVDEDDLDGHDNDDFFSAGPGGSGAPVPSTPIGCGGGGGGSGGSGCGGPSDSFAPLPRVPPPLARRRQMLPLPPNRGALPLMPSLTSPPPLPPAMMMLLVGDRSSPPRRGGPSPLLAACQGGHADTAALLLRRGAKVDTEGGAELLAAAHPQVVDELLAAVPDLSVHLDPALLSAASANRAEVVSALLRHGADSSFRGGMALQEAAFRSHLEVLEVLLAADSPRLQACGAVAAALNLAGCFRRVEVIKLLQDSAPEF